MAGAPTPAPAQGLEALTAAKLVRLCQPMLAFGTRQVPRGQAEAVSLCVGYMSGMIDAIDDESRRNALAGSAGFSHCRPRDVTRDLMIASFVDFIEERPTLGAENAPTAMKAMMLARYPCSIRSR